MFGIYLGILAYSVNIYVGGYMLCVSLSAAYVSQNVYPAASAAGAGGGGEGRKAEDENREGRSDQAPPIPGLGNRDLPPCEEI